MKARQIFGLSALVCAQLWLNAHAPHSTHFAYIGPGAGFAFMGSFLSVITGFFLTVVSLISWPFRMAWQLVRRQRGFRRASAKKIIFLGLDGLDPRVTERLMEEGKLPNLAKLRSEGSYSRLRTTFPALSPVAWSTFATGVNPAKHNIFDFVNRNTKSYVPELAAARVHPPARVLKVGRYRIPLSRAQVELKRKSEPFWKILGRQHIGSTILRVPITFPPDRFYGRQLSAMSTPDLRGTQGSFAQFTTRLEKADFESGNRFPLIATSDGFEGFLEGPDDATVEHGPVMKIPFRIRVARKKASLEMAGESFPLERGSYTPWIKLKFKSAVGVVVHGIARFLLTETEPHLSMYVSPVQIDPEKPVLPISHPSYYAAYLAKLLGTYSTLGMAEDTWALNEGVLDHDQFLDQSYSLLAEREAMFRHALETTRRGVVACVFDTSDRVQHMCFGSPETIAEMYRRMDALVGLAMQHTDRRTVLFVLSDHGFCSFRRGVNLNTWLLQNGYLHLKDGASEGGRYFQGVDWSRTRAYTVGLSGIYLNLKGREASGIVEPGEEADRLRRELIDKLTGLEDGGAVAIRAVYATRSLYQGPYLEDAPDLIPGFADGYRTSWDAAVGKIAATVFEDNRKAWCGDHSVDPALVPGVLFSNRKIEAENPGIEDLAPTALKIFGVDRPGWMDGCALIA